MIHSPGHPSFHIFDFLCTFHSRLLHQISPGKASQFWTPKNTVSCTLFLGLRRVFSTWHRDTMLGVKLTLLMAMGVMGGSPLRRLRVATRQLQWNGDSNEKVVPQCKAGGHGTGSDEADGYGIKRERDIYIIIYTV